ncbi:universal stress protein [Microlunatus ginsengisoli]|uniref:UspA domain-containing protein n=1 Tax=Microlunatus ginsengisoli TaxID=363863 RepID=A0ABP6ZEE1_9ACTN
MSERTIVVGVTPHQPDRVVREAARFARAFDASLVCAHVDPGAYVVDERTDGSIDSRPVDPDAIDFDGAVFDPALAERIETWSREESVAVEFRELAGDIAHALGRLAQVLDAQLIVVGSRRGGLRSSMHEFFGGSVAVHLAHRQPRPLVVVPLNPIVEGPLPWEPA